jgi:lipopolysaccharide/colanic/teichoic acid biosynthesis glycosyltransferase
MSVKQNYDPYCVVLNQERTAGTEPGACSTARSIAMRSATLDSLSLRIKWLVDVLGSAILLAILCPLFLVLALVILLDDGWPVIYRRQVVGKKGSFDAFKFRTMRRDADAILNANPSLRAEFERNFKLKVDPRVTRSGAILRKSSLDELPQLVNILCGEMSFVGPRMITAPELEKYGAFKSLLLSVKPGLTGYWQISGRQEVDYAERVRMDVHYIQNWSIWLDTKIILKTPLTVLRREGAY